MRWFLAVLLLAPSVVAAQQRTPWTTSRVKGSPEPAKPYVSEEVFGKVVFHEALEMVAAGGRFFIIENAGRIWSCAADPESVTRDLVIDLKALHSAVDHAYGIAFHPHWQTNRQVFVTYTVGSGLVDGTKLARFKLRDAEPPQLDPASEEVLLTWRSGGHNGASIHFGPDGMLYISTGDSEVPSPPDPLNTGQDTSDLLSSILRIDVDHAEADRACSIPADNPFVGKPNVRPELWAFGFRNPWKISFDRQGRLWCGDVGWELWEMIHLVKRGGNYGWSAMEATQPVKPETLSTLAPISPPVVAHPHSEAASITGGYVYEGNRLPELLGAYVYGDYETGKIWALWHDGRVITRQEEIADTPHKIVTFGRSEDGELYYIHWGNPSSIHRLMPNPQASQPATFPRRLSETGVFADTRRQTPAPGAYEFGVAEPMWQDGRSAQRFIALPGEASIDTQINRRQDGSIGSVKVVWPQDAVLARTITSADLPGHRIETQLLHYDGESWNGYSYRWNADNSDADLVGVSGSGAMLGGSAYRFHSRAECSRCHTPWAGFTLGFQPQQLTTIAGGRADTSGVALGLTKTAFFDQSTTRLVNSGSATAGLDARARSWLHANCAHCHRENGGGSVAIRLNAEMPLAATMLIGEKPLRGDFGIRDARIVAPGLPWRSVLINRIARTGSGHMPMIGAHEVDEDGVRLLWDWIAGLPSASSQPHPVSAASRLEDAEVAKLLEAHAKGSAGSEDLIKSAADHPATALRVLHAIGSPSGNAAEQQVLTGLARSSNANIASLFERFLPVAERRITLGSQIDSRKILALNGDAKRGGELIAPTGKLAVCLACHFVKGAGRNFGPDLSMVGARLTSEQILESIVTPSKTLAPGFAAYQVQLSDGSTLTGFVVNQNGNAAILKLATGQSVTLPRDQLATLKSIPGSLMPESLLQSLTVQEAADLVAYLASLR